MIIRENLFYSLIFFFSYGIFAGGLAINTKLEILYLISPIIFFILVLIFNKNDEYCIIKPSRTLLKNLKLSDMPIVNILSEKKIVGKLNSSTDTPAHLKFYKKYKKIKSINYIHSSYTTTWTQNAKPMPLVSTTYVELQKKEVPLIDCIYKRA